MSGETIDMSWQDQGAACRDTPIDWWFPDVGEAVPEEARRLCRACPVYAACYEHALRHEPIGVWAATTAQERQRLRRAAGLRNFKERDPVVVDQVAQMFNQGATPPQISEATGMNYRTVLRHLEAAGITVTDPDDWRRRTRVALRSAP